MIFRDILFALVVLLSVCVFSIISPGCGQIISPTGGPRDSIPPLLISASPANGTINFKANRITLNFNEYISLEQLQENLIVSPTPFSSPYIDYKLKTVTIKLRDTLQANTTYTINLGNSIRDLNESNPLGDFRYIFSTGSVIDTLNFSGNVILAESGNTDSTMLALLYKDLDDSAVYKRKAAYISRLDAKGNFTFRNLPGGTFRLFAIKDRDNGRTYNSPLEVFAFSDTLIRVSENTTPVLMYAYAEQREGSTASTSRATSAKEKNLSYKPSGIPRQDLTDPFYLDFNKPLLNFNKDKVFLTDTLNRLIPNTNITIDSTRKRITIDYKWPENSWFKLIVQKEIGKDSAGLELIKSDSTRFITKKSSDYGSLVLRFSNLEKGKNIVLQFVSGNDVLYSDSLTSNIWTNRLFKPGDYTLRLLVDENKNGKWDPGNYRLRKQPERVIAIPQSINVKADWENEIDVKL